MAKADPVAGRPTNPSKLTTRPPEPLRPGPARIMATSLLSTKARRRRYDPYVEPRYDS
jgi:hypothetical protein